MKKTIDKQKGGIVILQLNSNWSVLLECSSNDVNISSRGRHVSRDMWLSPMKRIFQTEEILMTNHSINE